MTPVIIKIIFSIVMRMVVRYLVFYTFHPSQYFFCSKFIVFLINPFSEGLSQGNSLIRILFIGIIAYFIYRCCIDQSMGISFFFF